MHLLIVDDNRLNRNLVGSLARAAGWCVDEAEDGAAGITQAGLRRYDLILMDIHMPGIDGVEATRTIRDSACPNRTTPIIAWTSDDAPETHRAALAAGIGQVLCKPVGNDRLLGILRMAAGSRGAVQAGQ